MHTLAAAIRNVCVDAGYLGQDVSHTLSSPWRFLLRNRHLFLLLLGSVRLLPAFGMISDNWVLVSIRKKNPTIQFSSLSSVLPFTNM